MCKKILMLLLCIMNFAGCYNFKQQNNQNNQNLHQTNNSYSYNNSKGTTNLISGANLSAPKYMKHRRPQRRFIHGAYK